MRDPISSTIYRHNSSLAASWAAWLADCCGEVGLAALLGDAPVIEGLVLLTYRVKAS